MRIGQKGFSLIELVIVAAITAMLMEVLFSFLVHVRHITNRLERTFEQASNAGVAMEKLLREARQAAEFEGGTPDGVTLMMLSGEKIVYRWQGERITRNNSPLTVPGALADVTFSYPDATQINIEVVWGESHPLLGSAWFRNQKP